LEKLKVLHKMAKKRTIVLSLGGSIIAPDAVHVEFLKKFRGLILDFVKKGNRAIIVCGGGGTNRTYNHAVLKITRPSHADLDWLGIAATKLNAELVRVMFGPAAFEKVIDNPTGKIATAKKIIVASGWKPGWSSDYDAVLMAVNFKSREVINLTNIDHVHNKDPNKFRDAVKLETLTWDQYLAIVGKKWQPRMSVPFDPTASKLAKSKKISVRIVNGTKLQNIKKLLADKKVIGTLIK